MSDRISDLLYGYDGNNPFRDRKSSSFGDARIATEFSPTSKFWSLFNEHHEILLGTRGSGKTVLLRMLSYSCLKIYADKTKDEDAKQLVESKRYIGFYIPMHLEFAASLPDEDDTSCDPIVEFNFAFNSVAAAAILDQLELLIKDCSSSDIEALTRESLIISLLEKWWFPKTSESFRSISEIRQFILKVFHTATKGSESEEPTQLKKAVLRPILNILDEVSAILGLDPDKTTWLACVDEAEFLKPIYIKAVNSFLRDEKRPLVVKMATLPFAHMTRETLYDNVEVEADDFDYNWIDLAWDSDDFELVSNHICRVRLQKISVPEDNGWSEFIEKGTLGDFVGRIGNDERIDYFKNEIEWPENEWSDAVMIEKIVAELSPKRKKAYDSSTTGIDRQIQPILKKFRPVFFVRLMQREDKKGNRSVGWFAGEETIRRASDGNPRLFIQIMNMLVEASRAANLTPKEQHRRIFEFCKRRNENSQGLPQHGVTIKELMDVVSARLWNRIHGEHMLDSGCYFNIEDQLLENKVIAESLKVAISYSHVRVPDIEALQFSKFDESTEFRLGYSNAIASFLVMRKGGPPCIRSKHQSLFDLPTPTNDEEAKKLIKQLDIEFEDE